ncbi:MAG: flippase-like domain-containing protein [Chitinophagaceae bacterium]|nr:flippase-like domain-containing protein [Chitinophagaceae bacterium]
MFKNKSIKLFIKFTLGALLFSWLFYSLFIQISKQENLTQTISEIFTTWGTFKIALLILVIALMIVNWSIEALKWKLLLKQTEEISFIKALQSTLTGVAVSIITPNRIGEYFGRILYLKNKNKIKGISITITGSFAQFIVAGAFGVFGLCFYLFFITSNWWLITVLCISILIIILLLYVIFNLKVLLNFIEKIPYLRRLKVYIEVVSRFDRKVLKKIILLSALRYLVYSTQFYLLLCLTHNSLLSISIIPIIQLIFWVMAIIPSVAIADLGVRGEAAIYFLSSFSTLTNPIAILLSTTLLWIINLILPALIGCFFVFKMKLFDDDE